MSITQARFLFAPPDAHISDVNASTRLLIQRPSVSADVSLLFMVRKLSSSCAHVLGIAQLSERRQQ